MTVLCSAALLLGCIIFFAARWYINVYGDVGFDSILLPCFPLWTVSSPG